MCRAQARAAGTDAPKTTARTLALVLSLVVPTACGRSGLSADNGGISMSGSGGATTTSGTTTSSAAGATTSATSTSVTSTTSTGTGGGPPGCAPITKCNASWIRSLPAPLEEQPIGRVTGVAGDPCGRIALAGHAPIGFDVDGMKLGPGLFAAQLDPDGVARWARLLWGTSGDVLAQSVALATDPSGSVAVAGWLNSGYGIDGLSATTQGGEDAVVLALDGDGHAMWLRSFGTPSGDDRATCVASGAGGRVAVGGVQAGGIDAGAGPLAGGAFVAVFSPTGEPLWSYGFGDPTVHLRSVAMAPAGDVYLTGWFSVSMSIAGGPTLLAAGDGSSDVFVVRLSPVGAHVWSSRYGDAKSQRGYLVASRPSGGIALVGEMAPGGSTDFGGGPLDAQSGVIERTDFLVALAADGTHVLSESVGLAPGGGPRSLAVGGDGTAALTIVSPPPTLLRIAPTGEIVGTLETNDGVEPPQVGRVPGGTVIANTAHAACDIGVGTIEANALYVARLCDDF